MKRSEAGTLGGWEGGLLGVQGVEESRWRDCGLRVGRGGRGGMVHRVGPERRLVSYM